jgi:hypothetical protein
MLGAVVWPLYSVRHYGSSGTWPEWAYIVNFIFWSVLGVTLLIYRMFFYRRQPDQATAGAASPPRPPKRARAALNALQLKDPAFNQQVFLGRVQATFFAVQSAWMARNLQPARIYMSDGLFRSWQTLVDQQVQAHSREVMENLVVGGMVIAQVSSDQNFDGITVKIDASADDYDVDDRTGKAVGGRRQKRAISEYWTFIRSATARTRAGEQAQITQCPNCGAPVSVNESGVCAYCKATVTTGQFGWVLDRITQASEWGQTAA